MLGYRCISTNLGNVILFHSFTLTLSLRRAVIPYVVFFFGATGGVIGLAAQAGREWAIASSFIFLVMAAMAFVQRAKIGL